MIGSQFDGGSPPWNMQAATDFQNADAAGKGMSILPMYQPFSDCSTSPCTPYGFPASVFSSIRSAGSIPMISWGSSSLQDGETNATSDPNFTLADVANGTYDSYITSWAEAAKAWGHPFFLRFDWEMNGSWFVWGNDTNSNTAAEYVAAWRHVHDIFASVGATNATWVWCPNNGDDNGSTASIASFYPGSAYVDWTCMDAYNQGGSNWQTWDGIAQSAYQTITSIAPDKPMMLGEVGSVADGGSRPAWLTQMLSELPTSYPQVHALIYYDEGGDALETDPASVSAFSAGINSPAYSGANYSTLTASGAIPAP